MNSGSYCGVSIVIPTYNREKFIARAVNSALSQSHLADKIIICDNFSTDLTFEICKNFQNDHPDRVVLIRNSENMGPVRNWKKCIDQVKSPYTKILFSDDAIPQSYIEKTLPFLHDKNIAFVTTPALIGPDLENSSVYYSISNGAELIPSENYRDLSINSFGKYFAVSPGAGLFRTEDLRKNLLTDLPGIQGYDFCRTGAGVDWLVFLLTSLDYPLIAYTGETAAYFCAHEDSITIRNQDNEVSKGYGLAKSFFLNEALMNFSSA